MTKHIHHDGFFFEQQHIRLFPSLICRMVAELADRLCGVYSESKYFSISHVERTVALVREEGCDITTKLSSNANEVKRASKLCIAHRRLTVKHAHQGNLGGLVELQQSNSTVQMRTK
jgi:hypothetical protein